ncbi:MAG TPA: integration host factor subunit alpha [Syntrophorhabdus sp.]|nr:integration host factor subunit alpha [Syntrophorhabdus sp.]
MALTKVEIVNMLCEQTDMPRSECSSIVESFFKIIKSELERGNPVMISGFGKWTVAAKRARSGRNPQTGDNMTIAARNVVSFRPSIVLKKELNA